MSIDQDTLKQRLKDYTFFHSIQLGDGIETPGQPLSKHKKYVLKLIASQDLVGKRVLDIGCANGLLLESVRDWTPHALVPHGIDFVQELIEYARARHPGFEANFAVANVWEWEPARAYDYVRTNLEYVPPEDWPEYLRRVARPARRLIVCHYVNADEQLVDCAELLDRCGYDVAGESDAPGVSLAWTDVRRAT